MVMLAATNSTENKFKIIWKLESGNVAKLKQWSTEAPNHQISGNWNMMCRVAVNESRIFRVAAGNQQWICSIFGRTTHISFKDFNPFGLLRNNNQITVDTQKNFLFFSRYLFTCGMIARQQRVI